MLEDRRRLARRGPEVAQLWDREKPWHWQVTAKVQRNRQQGAQVLLGPMAEMALEDTGLGVRAAPQDASVSAGESPQSRWVGESDITSLPLS